jgi:histidinol-phosphate aminotransferase
MEPLTPPLRWPQPAPTVHGGPDAGAPVRWDLSTNANPFGPLAPVAQAVAAADRSRYPEPGYAALRSRLAQWHGVAAEQVMPAASAGEWIWRFTLALRQAGGARRVWLPAPGYGEYRAAAAALGAACGCYDTLSADAPLPSLEPGDLLWICEPNNPTGGSLGSSRLAHWITAAVERQAEVVLDLAYEPLRLDGAALPDAARQAWQLWSPNKACGLTGVRGAYALAPAHRLDAAHGLRGLAPSWVLGADGAAMVSAFASVEAADLLAAQRQAMAVWRGDWIAALRVRGWVVGDGVTPFLLARPPGSAALAPLWHAAWRQRGFKLRDAASFGLRGWVRVGISAPAVRGALMEVCDAVHGF